MDFVLSSPGAVAAVESAWVSPDKWSLPHYAVDVGIRVTRWAAKVQMLVEVAFVHTACWMDVVDQTQNSKNTGVGCV